MKKELETKIANSIELTHGSLFSGIGGFELGAERAGIPTIWNCEIEERKRKILKRHFPQAIQYEDVTKMENPPYVDIISGGFPCQDISIAQYRFKNDRTKDYGIHGQRSGLWSEFSRLIRSVRPKYVLIENSAMLPSRGLEYVLCDLWKSGYDAEWQTLSARMFGFPHIRKRCYIVAYAMQKRHRSNEYFGGLQEILCRRTPRQITLSVPLERINPATMQHDIRISDGFSRGLDKRRIEDCGNAVIPTITEYLFETIKEFETKTN